MFAVYHEDKYTRYLLKLCETLNEAQDYVNTHHGHRMVLNRDRVFILDDTGQAYQVDYMAQFEALKSWTFPSSSSSKTYETRLTKTGILSCDCMGWTRWAKKKKGEPRGCWHTEEVIRQEKLAVKAVGQYWVLEDSKIAAAKKKYAGGTTTPEQRFAAILAEYENAIQRMAKLDPKDMWKMAEQVELMKFKVEAYMGMLEEKGIDGMALYEATQAKVGMILQ